MNASRRILYLTSFFPYPPHGGGKLRVKNMIQQLSRRHEIHLLALGTSSRDLSHEAGEMALEWCDTVKVIPHRLDRPSAGLLSLVTGRPYELCLLANTNYATAADRALEALKPDLVWCSRLAMVGYLSESTPALRILDQHDLSSYLWHLMASGVRNPWMRLYARFNRTLVRRAERRLFRRVDLSIAVSPKERDLTADIAPPGQPLLVAPNGVDPEYFRPDRHHREVAGGDLVLVGQMDAVRNVDAAVHFANDMLPRIRSEHPAASFCIVGARPRRAVRRLAERPGVVVTGFVEDVRPYIEQAKIVVVPHRMGSGVKHKIPIAMAMAKPIVTTHLGCQGIDLVHGEHALVEDDPHRFATAVSRLLGHPDLGEKLATAARRLAVERYSWERIVDRLDREIDAVWRQRTARRPLGTERIL